MILYRFSNCIEGFESRLSYFFMLPGLISKGANWNYNLKVDSWYNFINEPTLADAIMD
ncbi:hypothetical protein AAKU52_000216 [Pedobacter sp. CG_S7]